MEMDGGGFVALCCGNSRADPTVLFCSFHDKRGEKDLRSQSCADFDVCCWLTSWRAPGPIIIGERAYLSHRYTHSLQVSV
jgi:hypothetical protein